LPLPFISLSLPSCQEFNQLYFFALLAPFSALLVLQPLQILQDHPHPLQTHLKTSLEDSNPLVSLLVQQQNILDREKTLLLHQSSFQFTFILAKFKF